MAVAAAGSSFATLICMYVPVASSPLSFLPAGCAIDGSQHGYKLPSMNITAFLSLPQYSLENSES